MAEDTSLERREEPQRKRILYVEDDKALRRLGEVILSQAGYEITTVADFEEAESILKENNNSYPDLIVSDFELGPGKKNGWDVCKMAKELNIPAILATSHAEDFKRDYTKEELLKRGVYGAIQKPFRMDVLRNAVSSTLENQKPQ